ncbi:hypothetical protein F5141DRAFT_1292610 [Pisolithus sp. B1]|nr:hypothetical protein F5141DRAFT_1292610 [Pisolithus sp. B1]
MLNVWVKPPSRVETIVRERLAKLSCTVELGARLISFSQIEECIRAKVVNHRGDDGEEEVEEYIERVYLIGVDGTRGMTRKQLGLTFLGTTRERNFLVVEDIHLEVKIETTHTSSVGCRKIYAVSYDTQ